MKKFKRASSRVLQDDIIKDLTLHVMNRVCDAALDVAQLVDTKEDMVGLHISGMVALMTQAIVNTAPKTATRAQMVRAAKLITDAVAGKFSATLDEISDEELAQSRRPAN